MSNINAEHYLALSKGLRSSLNLALGFPADSIENINPKVIKERTNRIKSGDIKVDAVEKTHFYLYTQVWSLNFAIRFGNSGPWATLSEDSKRELQKYGNIISVNHIVNNAEYYAMSFLKEAGNIKTTDKIYDSIYPTLVYLVLYGLFMEKKEIIGASVLTILETL